MYFNETVCCVLTLDWLLVTYCGFCIWFVCITVFGLVFFECLVVLLICCVLAVGFAIWLVCICFCWLIGCFAGLGCDCLRCLRAFGLMFGVGIRQSFAALEPVVG